MKTVNIGERILVRWAPGILVEGYINELGDFISDPKPDHSFTD